MKFSTRDKPLPQSAALKSEAFCAVLENSEAQKSKRADRIGKTDKATDKASKLEKVAKSEKEDASARRSARGLRHVAIIMDGNGRWAKQRLMPRSVGHREGLKAIEKVCKAAKNHGTMYLSFYAFSTENWRRPKKEVDSLMSLLKTRLPRLADQFAEQNIRLLVSGDLSAFDTELKEIILQAQCKTLPCGGQKAEENPQFVVNICLNYGGRQEIVAAANRAVALGKQVDEKEFSRLLYTKDLPDPDLLIRTGGERRVSNFLLFQLAYTELYFCDKLWPDFDENDFAAAAQDFYGRSRRFGGL